MKAIIKDKFYTQASEFTLESMIYELSALSLKCYKGSKDDHKGIYEINSSVIKVKFLQWYAIDMLHEIINKCRYGNKKINHKEIQLLYGSYNDMVNKRKSNNKKDILLKFYSLAGEQIKFQKLNWLLDDFSREKYITEELSNKVSDTNISFLEEFEKEASCTTDEYSAIIFMLMNIYETNNVLTKAWLKNFIEESGLVVNIKLHNMYSILDRYSISIEKIKSNNLGRQIFYVKPIIKIGDSYVLANMLLLRELFKTSNYWLIRNKYEKIKSQQFINEFGNSFELYVEEVLEFCVSKDNYKKVDEHYKYVGKKADWYINVANKNFIIEQKSGLLKLDAKQNNSNIESAKEFLMNNLKEAIHQLNDTEKGLQLNDAIKIILVYDNYLLDGSKSALSELNNMFKMDEYWLINIEDFENIMMIYKYNKGVFIKIVEEKIKNSNLDLYTIMLNYKEYKKNYLKEKSIFENVEKVLSRIKSIDFKDCT